MSSRNPGAAAFKALSLSLIGIRGGRREESQGSRVRGEDTSMCQIVSCLSVKLCTVVTAPTFVGALVLCVLDVYGREDLQMV